jgi:putative transposase
VTYKVLFVLLILAHHRRRVVHVNVTEHPTAQWTAQQIVDAFPSTAPPEQGSEDIMTAPLSLWQKPYVERLL